MTGSDGQDLLVAQAALALGAGDDGHAGGGHGSAGGRLVAHGGDGTRARADEGQPGLLHLTGEVVALGEEAVTRMDGARPAGARQVDDLVAAKV